MPGAKHPGRRTVTAREAAEQFGASTRTIQRLVAEPRDEFLERARERRDRIVALRKQGLKYKDIAEEMGITTGTVSRVLHDARKLEERKKAAQPAENCSVSSS